MSATWPGRRDRDVDGHAGGDLVARLGVGVDDVAARDVLAQRLDQARRERARRACVRRAPVRRGVHGDREHEQRRRPGGELRPLERGFVFQKHKPDDERGDPAADREPGHEGRAALLEPVRELARVGELQRDPADERRGQDQPSEQRAQHDEAAGERERQRPEAGGAARLRDRGQVGEGHEELRHEHHRGDGEEAAEHVGRPAPPQREAGERDEQERRHRDRTGAAEHLGGQPVARVREDVELSRVLPERALQLLAARIVRAGVADDREQPDEVRRRRHDQRRERGRDPPRLAALDQRADEEEAREREPEEDRVGRVDDREHEPRGGDGRERGAARSLDVGEREGERGRKRGSGARPSPGGRARCRRRRGRAPAPSRRRRRGRPRRPG